MSVMPTTSASHSTATTGPGLHRDERGKRLKGAIIASLLTKPLAFIIPLATVPLFIGYLGNEQYGLYESLVSLSAWFAASNIGIGLGLMNRLTECFVNDEKEMAARYTCTVLVLTGTLLVSVALVFTVLALRLDWNAVFPMTTSVPRTIIAVSAWASVSGAILSVFAANVTPIYSAYQRLSSDVMWDAFAKIASLATCFLAAWTSFGIIGVIFAVCWIPPLCRLLNLWVLVRFEMPWLVPRLASFDAQLVAPLLRDGFLFFFLQIASIALFNVDKLVISVLLGPSEVTEYAIVGRLYLAANGLFGVLLTPLWPAFGEALRRKDFDWVNKMIRRSTMWGLTVMLGLTICLGLWGDQIIRIWTRNQVQSVPFALICGLGLSFSCWVWISSRAIALHSMGILRPQILTTGAHALLNVLFALVLVRHFGAKGAAWASCISGMLTSVWAYPWLLQRHIFRHP